VAEGLITGVCVKPVRSWAYHTVGGLPPTFWYLWTGTLINRLGTFVLPFLAIYLTSQRGFSAALAGLIVGAYGAGAAVGTLLGGVLADRWGRRSTLLTAQFGAVIWMVSLGFARDRYLLICCVVVLGLFTEGCARRSRR